MSHQIDKETVVIKVIVLGSANVGKTALMERYCCDKFSNVRTSTIGSDFRTKLLELDEQKVALQVWDTAGLERFHAGTLGNSFYRGANGAILVYDIMNPRSIQQLAQWRDEAISKIDVNVSFPIVVIGNKVDLKEVNSHKLMSQNNSVKTSGTNSSSSSVERSEFQDCGDDTSTTWIERTGGKGNDMSMIGELDLEIDQEEIECKDPQLSVLQWCRRNSYGHLETSARDNIGIETAMLTIAGLALQAYKSRPKQTENSKKNKKINLHNLYVPKVKGTWETCGI